MPFLCVWHVKRTHRSIAIKNYNVLICITIGTKQRYTDKYRSKRIVDWDTFPNKGTVLCWWNSVFQIVNPFCTDSKSA